MAYAPTARHLLRAKDLADARYAEPLDVADLAKAAGLTYLPPVQPAILGDELLKVLQK